MENYRRKGLRGFKKGLLIYVLILAVLMLAATAVLWRFLANFQKGIDEEAIARQAAIDASEYEKNVKRAPQLCFEDFAANADGQYWADLWFETHPGSFDDPDQVTAFMTEKFDADACSLYKAEEYSEAAPVYVIKNGEERLAAVSVSGSELDWSVSKVALLIEGTESARQEVPEGCTVYCSGTALGEDYVVSEQNYFKSEAMKEYQDKFESPVLWVTYEVSGQLFSPELTVEAPADKTLRTDSEGNYYYVLSAQAAQEYQAPALTFTEKLLYFYMQGGAGTYGNAAAAQNCVVMNSQAYKLIASAAEGVTWNPSYMGSSSSTEVGDAILWADNCISVDVKYHYEGTVNSQKMSNDGIYRIYFMDVGQGFQIYGLENTY